MPRAKGKKTIACQTDTVYLSEDQVENIIAKSLSNLNDELTRLQNQMKDLKSNNDSLSLTSHNGEVNNLQKDFSDVKSTIDKLTKDSDALNNLQQAAEFQVEQLQERLDNVEEKNNFSIQKLYKQIETKDEVIRKVQEKNDELEQIHKLNNLRIAGLEEDDGEDVQCKVITLAKKMKLALESTDITDARRMGPRKENKTRDILVRFSSSLPRDTLYKRRKMLRDTNEPVYVNEDLTQRRSLLFYEGRRLRKQGKIFGIWSQKGNILIKVNQYSQPRTVINYNEIIAHIEEEDTDSKKADNLLEDIDEDM